MTENKAASRIGSLAGPQSYPSSNTPSSRSSSTAQNRTPVGVTPTHTPSSATPRHSSIPFRLSIDSIDRHPSLSRDDSQASPTCSIHATPSGQSPEPTMAGADPTNDRRLSDLSNYRKDLAVLEPTKAIPVQKQKHSQPQQHYRHQPTKDIAPWVSPSASAPSHSLPIGFYNDSTESLPLSQGLQSSGSRSGMGQLGASFDSPDDIYYGDRRPSAASVTTTASSQGSKTSAHRGGFRKLQGFFGEEFPGRDGSETSLPGSLPSNNAGGSNLSAKDQRSRSYSHTRPPQRDRNYSNATDREASPVSSRPRTPVPSADVVPFLYQDNNDIARYGEAPVRETMTGPDRERYISSDNPSQSTSSKPSVSARSGHTIVHLPGHRHNKSNDDPRALRPTASREDSTASLQQAQQYHHQNTRDWALPAAMYRSKSRSDSPTPSTSSVPTPGSRMGFTDGQASPNHHNKRGILGRLRRHKEKDDYNGGSRLKELPQSTKSLAITKPAKTEFGQHNVSPPAIPANWSTPPPELNDNNPDARATSSRSNTFNNKFPFSKKNKSHRHAEYVEEAIGPTDRKATGHVYHLDTNLNDMEGILTKPPMLTPLDSSFVNSIESAPVENPKPSVTETQWDAPDSWAVRRDTEDNTLETPEQEDDCSPPRPEEKLSPYCIRIFRSDGTFLTHSMPLDSTASDVISQVIKKTYVVDGLENYHIILKKHELIRVLGGQERPLLIQKRLLQQVGYEEKDRIEDLGREDNGYLCRFMFLSARESDFHAKMTDIGLSSVPKLNYVDISSRNLITIPISLYLNAAEIISLNLSRNLSLDVPRDFISSCKQLRDIKFTNNEARKLPASFSRAAKLTYLDVSNNRIEQLDNAELDNLTGLLKMNLANNRISHIPSYFGAYQSLRSLNMSSNFLEEFPTFLCDLCSLVDLDLSFNSIGSLPAEISNLKNLEKLLITNNRLGADIPETFCDLTSLRELDIKYNSIKSIDMVSQLPNLEILYAAHNQISSFVGSFPRIRLLKLNSNPLNKFEINEPVPTLKTLNLSQAQLASIDSSFANITNLEQLILDKNYFVSLPQQIGSLTKLEHFSLAQNTVGELPAQIGCLTELRVLDVRLNNLSKLPMEIWWASNLETLNVASNLLNQFPKPSSRPPRMPGEESSSGPPPAQNGKMGPLSTLSSTPSVEELSEDRRPSQSSSTLLSVGPSPVPQQGPDRKSSVVSLYGKGRKTSVVSRTTSNTASTGNTTTAPRKDSAVSQRLSNTFTSSLRNLCLADNRLEEDVFDQLNQLTELRVLNLSYNDDIGDVPQRAIKNWPQLVELYLSGNGLTTLPADDLEENSLLQALYINGNKFTNLPADISRAKKLAVLDCGNNYLKYNIANVPYDWNWNLNPNLRYLNLSGNKRLEIKQVAWGPGGPGTVDREEYTDFNRLLNLRVLGLMDVTLTQPSIPDQNEDKRVRTSGSLAGHLPYGMADTLGKNEHLSTVDLVVPRFNSSDTEMLLGLFDGQALSSGGSKIAKYLHENFGHIFALELKALKTRQNETPADALRRAFLSLNKELVSIAVQNTEERPRKSHRGSTQPVILSREDLNSGGVATVAYLKGTELYVANVGNVQGLMITTDGKHEMLTHKHDPAEPKERSRIRDAGGWVSRNGRLNDLLEVSRAFGYVDLMPAVQAAPHVSQMTIRETDDVLFLATSEIWEYLTPLLIVDIARAERGDLMRAAHKLRDIAIAHGATGKLMVMMISVADLKRRVERSRLHRGTSMSLYPSGVPDEAQVATRRRPKTKGDVMDSALSRLEAEIPAPIGNVSIVFTDIKNSTNLWEMYPSAMRSAIKLHNEVMRRQLRRIGGYEVKTEGDAFMVSFPTATSALLWCFAVQTQLLDVAWPSEVLSSLSGQPVLDKDNNTIFKGLSVRMGIHFGDCVSETDPVTRRMDYFGPMVNKASRISAVADGGQIAVSSDFISEIQRCLESYQDTDRNGSTSSDDAFDDDYAMSIRKDLRSLTSQGFEVKEMGEKKLKGLENPEVVYSLYPHTLAGRIEFHQQHERRDEGERPAIVAPGSDLPFDPEIIWALWRVSLRLEMLCSTLEEVRGPGLQPPETELLERMKTRGGEVTERFLVNFMEHQVSRIETCVSTLRLRYMAYGGGGPLEALDELRAPMAAVFEYFAQQKSELEQYKKLYGELPAPTGEAKVKEVEDEEEEEEE